MVDLGSSIAEYDYTWKLSRSRWAWEFLRRNTDFMADAERRSQNEVSSRYACHQITLIRPACDQPIARRWGLAFFPSPQHNGFEADVFWTVGVYDRSVHTHVGPRSRTESCEIYDRTVATCVVRHLTDTTGHEHLLLKGNGCVIQARCTGLSMLGTEPVRLSFIINSIDRLQTKLRTLQRAQRVYGANDAFETPEWSRNSLALRNALVALDCHAAGGSYYETAQFIYGAKRAKEAWSGPGRAMKDEMRRARQRGCDLVSDRYRTLLQDAANPPRETAA